MPGRGIGLGKIADGAFDHAPALALAEAAVRLDSSRRARTNDIKRTGHAARARRRDRDDLPGADDVAQSGHEGWLSAYGSHSHARRRRLERLGGPRSRHA